MRSEQEANRAIEQYADMVRSICMLHLKSHSDTEDIFQTVFLKYVTGAVLIIYRISTGYSNGVGGVPLQSTGKNIPVRGL